MWYKIILNILLQNIYIILLQNTRMTCCEMQSSC